MHTELLNMLCAQQIEEVKVMDQALRNGSHGDIALQKAITALEYYYVEPRGLQGMSWEKF